MAGKNSKSQRQYKTAEESVAKRQKAAQLILAIFAILLIISMVLSAVSIY